MVNAIKRGRTPNFFVLHYDRSRWEAQNLVLIPHFALSLSFVERRRPLGPAARRSGWVGCNIVIANIPPDATIHVLEGGIPLSPASVREQYARVQPLARLEHEARGWALDVLRLVRRIDREQFSLADIYAFRAELERLHPRNRHVQEKVRQQLQRLRDLGLVEFLGNGRYRLQGSRGKP